MDSTQDDRQPPRDLSHHLSRNARSRQASTVKQFYKYFKPGIGQLAGGLPNEHYFPFDTLEAKVAPPNRWKRTPNNTSDPRHGEAQIRNIVVPHSSTEQNPLKKIDLDTSLQYGTAQGYPPLYYFLRQFTRNAMHPNVPYRDGPEIVLTCGNTDGFHKVLQTLTNEWSHEKDQASDREGVLVEEFCYMTAVQAVRPRGLNVAPVRMDYEGMTSDGKGGLRDVLENWDHTMGRRPHLLYTVTMGQNPTSSVLSLARRQDLYAICSEYDVIIVEDDPYWYLQYSPANKRGLKKPEDTPSPEWKSSGYEFLDSLVPSSLNIDPDGRVIRLDTFSKTVAPGCRLGWITAQPALIERIMRITETSTQQPSGFVQSMVAELLMGPQEPRDKRGKLADYEGWKADGWVRWIEGLHGNYERRMNAMCRILDDHKEIVRAGRRNSLSRALRDSSLQDDDDEKQDDWAVVEKKQIYSFDRPAGGMFLWLRVHFEDHPLSDKVDHERLSRALWVFWTTKPYLVLVGPGSMFSSTDEIRVNKGWQYFRLCFAACDEPDLEPITKRVAEGTQAFFKIKKREVIDDLLKDDDVPAEQRAGLHELGQLAGVCF